MDSRELHLEALNAAIKEVTENFCISRQENHEFLNEMPSRQKLEFLNIRGLDRSLNDKILTLKQQKTIDWINSNISFNERLFNLFDTLVKRGYSIGIVTNAHRETAKAFLQVSGLEFMVSTIVGNEDVTKPKPHPAGFTLAMNRLCVKPDETLIFEDSEPGIIAAKFTDAAVAIVIDPLDLSDEYVFNTIRLANSSVLIANNVNIVVPMAGEGSRFKNAGYDVPKPFINVEGKPMFAKVIETLEIKSNVILLSRQWDGFDAITHMPEAVNVNVNGLTEGAACTVLLAKEHINNDNPLIVVNSDNLVSFDFVNMIRTAKQKNADGVILTFTSNNANYSFAKLDDNGYVSEVAEKNPISDKATAGVYYWRHGRDFVKYAEQMIANNTRVNNEFYVCPIYNEMIADQKKIICLEAKSFISLGTPDDLDMFLNRAC